LIVAAVVTAENGAHSAPLQSALLKSGHYRQLAQPGGLLTLERFNQNCGRRRSAGFSQASARFNVILSGGVEAA